MDDVIETKQNLIISTIDYVEGSFENLLSTVFAQFYEKHPQVEELFEYHSFGNKVELQQSMIDSIIHCSTIWYTEPNKVNDIIQTAIPQHVQLKIEVNYFTGLIEAFFDVVLNIIKSLEKSNQEAILTLREEFLALIGFINEQK